MKKISLITFCLLGLFFLNSCVSYIIPIESFKSQFSDIDITKYKKVKVVGPIGDTYNYYANPITTIWCKAPNGKTHTLVNSPSIETRITYKSNNKIKKSVFYFDRLEIVDENLLGVQSRFISAIKKSIPLKDIIKIEVQDGRKNFHYVQ